MVRVPRCRERQGQCARAALAVLRTPAGAAMWGRCRQLGRATVLFFVGFGIAIVLLDGSQLLRHPRVAPRDNFLLGTDDSFLRLAELAERDATFPNTSATPGGFFLPCELVNVSVTSSRRQSLVLDCDSSQWNRSQVAMEAPPFRISFRNTCLESFIKHRCYDNLMVPRLVHYVWFGRRELDVYAFLSVLSAVRFLRPCAVLFHADTLPFGPYWNFLLILVPDLLHVYRPQPEFIHGKRFGFVQHKSDIARLEALQEYGGVYLDGDQWLLRPMDIFRRFEFTMGHENARNLGNSLMVARAGAPFLAVWYQSYRTYNPRQWGIHSTYVPLALARKYPQLIRVENGSFIRPDLGGIKDVYYGRYDWSQNFAIHLYTRFLQQTFSLDDFRTMNSTLGDLARWILYGSTGVCLK